MRVSIILAVALLTACGPDTEKHPGGVCDTLGAHTRMNGADFVCTRFPGNDYPLWRAVGQ